MAAAKDTPVDEMSLEWIQMRTEMYKMQPESFSEKSVRKFKENPLVPIGIFVTVINLLQPIIIPCVLSGCLATFGALSYGLWSFRKGDRKMSQYMMRTRIIAQGFTLTALLVGIAMGLGKAKST